MSTCQTLRLSASSTFNVEDQFYGVSRYSRYLDISQWTVKRQVVQRKTHEQVIQIVNFNFSLSYSFSLQNFYGLSVSIACGDPVPCDDESTDSRGDPEDSLRSKHPSLLSIEAKTGENLRF